LLLTKYLRDYVQSLKTTFALRKKDKRKLQGRHKVMTRNFVVVPSTKLFPSKLI